MTARTPLPLLFSLFTLAGCHSDAPAADVQASPASTASPATGASDAIVRLSPSQLEQVHIEAISTTAPDDAIRATGVVEFNADRMARILPPVAGQVRDLAVNVGDTVAKDAVLFVLSSREVAAAIADHRASHKDLELAEKTSAMTQDLFEHQAASHIAQQQAENELAKAKARVLQTEEVLQVLGLDGHPDEDATHLQGRVPVRSPIAGTVIERSVTNGQFVGPDNPPLATIADLSSVWVQADVFERDVHNIIVGGRAEVTTTAYPDEHFIAHVAQVGSVVDAQTRTAKVRIQVANRDLRLKPGMFASVALSLPTPATGLTLPAKAVFVENGKSFAYVQVHDGSPEFVRRGLETMPIGADHLRIVSGLSAGDHIVSDGVLLLRQLEADAPHQ
jgi:cobalt-zinc-cadmium efflux system membrane fusion protein